MYQDIPTDIREKTHGIVNGFTLMNDESLTDLIQMLSLQMTKNELRECQAYFTKVLNCNPTIDELQFLDRYLTAVFSNPARFPVSQVKTENAFIKGVYESLTEKRKELNPDADENPSLSEIAAIIGQYEKSIHGGKDDKDNGLYVSEASLLAESCAARSVTDVFDTGFYGSVLTSSQELPLKKPRAPFCGGEGVSIAILLAEGDDLTEYFKNASAFLTDAFSILRNPLP